jgi:ribosomal protein L11 methyltransferase
VSAEDSKAAVILARCAVLGPATAVFRFIADIMDSNNKSPNSWFSVTLRPLQVGLSSDAFDGLCADLLEIGAAGTAVDRAPEITCYLEGDQKKADLFVDAINKLNCELISLSKVANENWTGACPDVWEPIRAGNIEIVPVQSIDDPRPSSKDSIRIIPGLGFGTGHHATTRMVLLELCEYSKQQRSAPPRIFDLGTGSGILAIAAAKLLNTEVEGNDIELGAIDNARDNIALNNLQDKITVSNKDITEFSGHYDLILANVYGEVLMNLAPEVTRLSRPGTTAILSGITEIVWDQVWSVYGEKYGWSLVSDQNEGGWIGARLVYS